MAIDIDNNLSPAIQNDKIIIKLSPRGSQGATGEAATITIGEVTALPAGDPPTVTNTGDEQNAILNFGIPLMTGSNSYSHIRKIKDYLYELEYMNIDYDYAYSYFEEHYVPNPVVGCSAFCRNGIFGRNYDWDYSTDSTFVLRVPRQNGKYASIGVAGGIKELSDELVGGMGYSEKFKILPFFTLDGVNEKGVSCTINAVPTDYGETTGTTPAIEQKGRICMLMLPRFILDNYSSATEAVQDIQNYYSIYSPHSETVQQECHFMISDTAGYSYILEFKHNQLICLNVSTKPYITNFFVDGTSIVNDMLVYDLTTHTYNHDMGLERYQEILNASSYIVDVPNALRLCGIVKATRAYDNATSPFWYTDFVVNSQLFGDLTTQIALTSPSRLTPVIEYSQELYRNRERDGGTSWTVHSSVYDMVNKKLYLQTDETDETFEFELTLT